MPICLHCLPRLKWLAAGPFTQAIAHLCYSLAFLASYEGPVSTHTLHIRRIHSVPPRFQCCIPCPPVLFLLMIEGVISLGQRFRPNRLTEVITLPVSSTYLTPWSLVESRPNSSRLEWQVESTRTFGPFLVASLPSFSRRGLPISLRTCYPRIYCDSLPSKAFNTKIRPLGVEADRNVERTSTSGRNSTS